MNLETRRKIILLSLVIKGVLFYSTIAVVIAFLITVDSLSTAAITIGSMIVSLAVYEIYRIISLDDIKRILFLSKSERRDFDRETV